jgi:hypothetical protein
MYVNTMVTGGIGTFVRVKVRVRVRVRDKGLRIRD